MLRRSFQYHGLLTNMLYLLYFLLCVPSFCIPLPEPDPLQSLEKRAFDCQDTSPAAVFDASCWQQLNLSDFITGWRVEPCPPDSTGKNCSLPGEPWSTTFLRLAKGQAGFDCSSVSVGSCHYDSDLDENLDPKIKPQVRYVMYTIFSECNNGQYRIAEADLRRQPSPHSGSIGTWRCNSPLHKQALPSSRL